MAVGGLLGCAAACFSSLPRGFRAEILIFRSIGRTFCIASGILFYSIFIGLLVFEQERTGGKWS